MSKKGKGGKSIPDPRLPKSRGTFPEPVGPPPATVVFCFRYLTQMNPKFAYHRQESNYFCKLLERLQALGGFSGLQLKQSRSSALRFHPIDFSETSEPHGFRLAGPLGQSEPYQFEISANAHGRVHGVFVGSVFHVVWLDPLHQLYPSRR
jgi:hypothetical protein